MPYHIVILTRLTHFRNFETASFW